LLEAGAAAAAATARARNSVIIVET